MAQARQTKVSFQTKPIIRALQGHKDPQVPFWFMRQAGRYLPEYRELRKKAGSFLGLCFDPAAAAEVTLQPLKRFDMDAAILFSDILVIPKALGQELDFVEGEGPRLGELHIEKLSFSESELEPVYETLQIVRSRLQPEKTLIGFAGSPWTVACYMIEGRGTGHFKKAMSFAREEKETFALLMDKITDATIRYLSAQARSGADTLQLFDSWAGLLSPAEFRRWVIEPTKRIRASLKDDYPEIPVIGFPRGAKGLYSEYASKTGVECVGLDCEISMEEASVGIPETCAIQGNLDPVLLLQGGKAMEEAVHGILDAASKRSFVFNLGHGIVKETPPENVAFLSSIVKAYSR